MPLDNLSDTEKPTKVRGWHCADNRPRKLKELLDILAKKRQNEDYKKADFIFVTKRYCQICEVGCQNLPET